MILVIDTSSTMAAVVTIDGERWTQELIPSRDPELIEYLHRTARLNRITRVAVVTGPGSFTGLRKGVSFGLGLAIGLRIPIVPLPTLELQAARSDQPVTAVAEAGRGRFYYLEPGEEIALGEPSGIPAGHDLVGRVSAGSEATLQQAGHRLKPDSELRPLAGAAAALLKTAREVPYDSLKLEYVQSFSASK